MKLLVAAQNDPQQLLATPNSLLVSQPSVSQLKNALVNAQIAYSRACSAAAAKTTHLSSRPTNPRASIRRQLNNEVAVAIRGLQVEIELCADREKSLAAKWSAARDADVAAGRSPGRVC